MNDARTTSKANHTMRQERNQLWTPPGPVERIAALEEIPFEEDDSVRCACSTCYGVCHEVLEDDDEAESSPPPGSFTPKIPPEKGEWLATGQPGEEERFGQSYKDYVRGRKRSRRKFPNASRRTTIYLCNIDGIKNSQAPVLLTEETMERFRFFVQAFFCLPCKVLQDVSESERSKFTRNENDDDPSLSQYGTGSIHKLLRKRKNKLQDAFAVVGITMVDLYPTGGWNWNFVFGEADPDYGVGVCSLARFDPTFQQRWEDALLPPSEDKEEESVGVTETMTLLRTTAEPLFWKRAMQTLCHELGHLFHMEHCVYYECLMNGAKHLAEQDQSPLHLCPICLRKLHHAVEAKGRQPFSPLRRYQSLADFFAGGSSSSTGTTMDWSAESLWVAGAMQRCCPASATTNTYSSETSRSANHQVSADGPTLPKGHHFCACCVDQQGGMSRDGNGGEDALAEHAAEEDNRFSVCLLEEEDSD